MIDDNEAPASGDRPVVLTPLDGVDLVAVTPRSRSGLPIAVQLVEGALAGEVASLISEGSVSATEHAPCPAAPPRQHPAAASSSVRARRALNRLVARAQARARPDSR